MNIRFRNVPVVGVKKFQQGGPVDAPAEGGAPAEAPMEEEPAEQPKEGGAPQGGGDPMEMLMQIGQMAAQALQSQDCNVAMQACDGIVQFIQMMQQGGGAPQQKAPQGEPVYRRGGKLVGYIRK